MEKTKMILYGENNSGLYRDYENIIADSFRCNLNYRTDQPQHPFVRYSVVATTKDPKKEYVLGMYTAKVRRDFELRKCIEADKNGDAEFTFKSDKELKELAEGAQLYSDEFLEARLKDPSWKMIYELKQLLSEEELKEYNKQKEYEIEDEEAFKKELKDNIKELSSNNKNK